jgi:hypothetical protein
MMLIAFSKMQSREVIAQRYGTGFPLIRDLCGDG